jgi:hypothetical protein
MPSITLKKVEKAVSKESLLKYLRSLSPGARFNMEDGCACAYHGLLCDAFSLDDNLVGAYLDEIDIDGESFYIGATSFATRFQQVAMEKQVSRASRSTTAARLIEIAEGVEE